MSNWTTFSCRIKLDEDKVVRDAMATCGLNRSNRSFLITASKLLNTALGKEALKQMLKEDVETSIKSNPSFLS